MLAFTVRSVSSYSRTANAPLKLRTQRDFHNPTRVQTNRVHVPLILSDLYEPHCGRDRDSEIEIFARLTRNYKSISTKRLIYAVGTMFFFFINVPITSLVYDF